MIDRKEERTAAGKPGNGAQKRALVLEPVERVSEIAYGVLMALAFTGSLSMATAGREEITTMLVAAIAVSKAQYELATLLLEVDVSDTDEVLEWYSSR